MSLSRKKQKVRFFPQPSEYIGYVGLKTISNFDRSVMMPAEIKQLFGSQRRYEALFVYPFLVSDGFDCPVIFSGENVDETGFTLKAEIISNRQPKTWTTWFAETVILPETYIVRDRIEFKSESSDFGKGAFTISTIDCCKTDGGISPLASFCLSVKNRPGLFLKISKQGGDFYENAAFFFPDKAEGMMHKPVQYGEAFVLVESGCRPDLEMIADIHRTFNALVKNAYGDEGKLYSIAIDDRRPIDEMVTPSLNNYICAS